MAIMIISLVVIHNKEYVNYIDGVFIYIKTGLTIRFF